MEGVPVNDPEREFELVRRAQGGNRNAFEELIRRYKDRLERAVASRLRAYGLRSASREEVVQEALLRGFLSLENFTWKGEESFLRWLGGITENVLRDHARGASTKTPVFQLDSRVANDDVSASRAMRRQERFDRLSAAVRGLRPEYREVILLSRVEGLGFDAIAERMNRSPAAVKQLLWRALKSLGREFSDTESLHLPPRSLLEEEDNEPKE